MKKNQKGKKGSCVWVNKKTYKKLCELKKDTGATFKWLIDMAIFRTYSSKDSIFDTREYFYRDMKI